MTGNSLFIWNIMASVGRSAVADKNFFLLFHGIASWARLVLRLCARGELKSNATIGQRAVDVLFLPLSLTNAQLRTHWFVQQSQHRGVISERIRHCIEIFQSSTSL